MGTIITDIKKLDLTGRYTYADYLLWRFKERVELIKGKVFEMSPAPGSLHQRVSGDLYYIFRKALSKGKCLVFSAPFDVRLIDRKKSSADNHVYSVVQPDLCVVCDKAKIDERGCVGPPDLVVEILSPGNSNKELGIKFSLYEENQVKEYWIVNPAEENVLVYTLRDGKYIGLKPCILGEHITSPLFPELKFLIKDIFTA